jgi:hypothetical protein
LWVLNPSQSKVANLEIAVLVDQNIGGLQIAMYDASRMNVFQASLSWISHLAERRDEEDHTQGFDRESIG